MRKTLLLAASAAVIACGMPAYAQDNDNNGKGHIETVTVTAERRSEDLMKTPITATVVNGQDLQNRDVINVNSLQFIAPNVTVNDLGQGIDFDIRGIGKGEHNTQTPVGVVTYRDGASTFPGYLTAEPFYDIKSVEVYRGPQGTFVGQNATGGAVFVTTNDPVIGGDYSGYVLGQYGNYNDVGGQGAVNIPISDTLAIRISGFGERRSSFYTIIDRDPADACPGNKYAGCKPGYNPGDLQEGAGRLSVLWQPTDALTVSLKYDALYQDFGAAPAVPYSQLQPVGACIQPWGAVNGCTGAYAFAINPYQDKNLFHVTQNAPNARLDREQRFILKTDYTLSSGIKLQSISDYNVGNGSWLADLDGTDYGNPGDYPYYFFPTFTDNKGWTFYDSVDETVWSQEFNIVSPDNQPITWVLGLYGQENDYTWRSPYQFWIAVGPRLGSDPTPNPGNFYQYTSWTFQGHTSNQDLAAFGQIEAKLGGGFQASLGGRYTETRSHNDVVLFSYGGTPYGTPFNDVETQKSSHLTYKGALDWTNDNGDFLYAFVATGYTGGGLNTFTTTAGGPAPFGAVTDTDYEAGWKRTSWFDGHVHTQLNAFYTDYQHFQITLSDPLIPRSTYEINLPGTTKIYGAEGETQATFGDFSLDATVGLLKSEVPEFWAIDPRYGQVAALFPGICQPASGGTHSNAFCTNVKGNPITYAPSFTYNFMAQYMFHLDNGGTLTPRVNFAHVAGQWASIFDDTALGDRLGARNLLGAQLEYNTGDWLLTLYGDNITNQQYVASNNSGGLYAGPPRQYGIRISKVF